MNIFSHKKNIPTLALKILSLIIGFILWNIVSSYRSITLSYQVPLSFYNQTDMIINAPDTITVTLKGHRSSFFKLHTQLAYHIDCSELQKGEQEIQVKGRNLFLPDELKLVHYFPSHFKINIKKDKDSLV